MNGQIPVPKPAPEKPRCVSGCTLCPPQRFSFGLPPRVTYETKRRHEEAKRLQNDAAATADVIAKERAAAAAARAAALAEAAAAVDVEMDPNDSDHEVRFIISVSTYIYIYIYIYIC